LFSLGTISSDLLRCDAAFAAELVLPSPTQMVQPSKAFSYPVFKGLEIDPNNPLNLAFIIDTENKGSVSKAEAQKLVNYFLAAVALPQKDLWVNLSPYEKDRVVTDELGATVLGEDLLAQDYLLKQLSSSLTDPHAELGKAYWRACAESQISNLKFENLKKIWIMPDVAQVFESGNRVLVTEATLKIESESSAMKVLLPAITREVNDSERFAPIRQAYYSMILGLWFKEKLKASVFKAYIDQKNVNGIAAARPQSKEQIFDAYVESFTKGVYHTNVKTRGNGKMAKKAYFSGGFTMSSAIIQKVKWIAPHLVAGAVVGTLVSLRLSLGFGVTAPDAVFLGLLSMHAVICVTVWHTLVGLPWSTLTLLEKKIISPARAVSLWLHSGASAHQALLNILLISDYSEETQLAAAEAFGKLVAAQKIVILNIEYRAGLVIAALKAAQKRGDASAAFALDCWVELIRQELYVDQRQDTQKFMLLLNALGTVSETYAFARAAQNAFDEGFTMKDTQVRAIKRLSEFLNSKESKTKTTSSAVIVPTSKNRRSADLSVQGGVDMKALAVESVSGSSSVSLHAAGLDPTMFAQAVSFTVTKMEDVSVDTALRVFLHSNSRMARD
jgi:hypothetical protein